MRILVACEFSGIVREAFKARGFDAWSCDLVDTEIHGQHMIIDSDMHLKDVVYGQHWDLLVAHPPCTRLCNSGWWYIKQNGLYEEVRQAAIFFNMLLRSPVRRKAVENPIMNPEAKKYIRKQDQIIQPFDFGEDASKSTCLWLEGLPKLANTDYFPPRIIGKKKRWANQTDGGWNKLSPGADRGKDRSRTFPGIAAAMADQWGRFLTENK